jgi:hypothetical protein
MESLELTIYLMLVFSLAVIAFYACDDDDQTPLP